MKTILIILLLALVVPYTGFLIVHFNNWSKALAKIKWWTVIYPLGIFGLTEYFMFFPAWYLRNVPILKWIFWIWMDDSRFKSEFSIDLKYRYANDYHTHLGGKEETMWTAYQWHIRNRVWNLDSLFRPRNRATSRRLVEMVKDKLFMDNYPVDQMASWIPMARLKYWKDGKESWDTNSGDVISLKHSIFGVGYLWEKIGGRLTFRYSFCLDFLICYVIFVTGENDKRYAFTLKFKAKKEIL